MRFKIHMLLYFRSAAKIVILILFLLPALCIFTGCSIPLETPPEPVPKPKPPPKKTKKIPINYYQFGKSVKGKPINGIELGDGKEGILIIASIHGDETAGTPLVRDLELFLKKNTQLLEGRKIILIPEINPDGVENKTRENANRVDINHNFSSNTPEPETKAILMAINQFRAGLIKIISLRQLDSIDFDGPEGYTEALALHMKKQCSLPIKRWGTTPGSLGNYGKNKGFSVITFGLPKDINPSDDVNIWNSFSKAIIAGIKYSTSASPATTEAVSSTGLTSTKYYFRKGVLLYEKNECWKAINSFKKVLKQSPGHDKAREYLSKCYYCIGNYFFKKNNYSKALRNFKVSYKYNNNCMKCRNSIKKCNELIRSLPPKNNLPETETQTDQDKEPLETETASVEPKPEIIKQPLPPAESCSSIFNKAITLFESKKYSSAKNSFKKALSCNNMCHECRKYLIIIDGVIQLNNNRFYDAVKLFNKALAFDRENSIIPDNRIIKDFIKNADIRQIDEFKSEFDQALKGFKGQNGYIQAASWFNNGEYSRVMKWLESSHFSQKANQHLKRARQYQEKCDKCKQYESGIKKNIYTQGDSHLNKEQFIEAVGKWETLYYIDPKYNNVKSKLTEARQLLKQLLKVLTDK